VTVELPRVPTIDDATLERHRAEHTQLDEAMTSAYPAVARLAARFASRTTVAAIAHVRMTFRRNGPVPLFPPPRRFLSAEDRARIAGCSVAYRHVDSRLAMVAQGLDASPALRQETPYVLHALSEGRMDHGVETNPGMIRGTEFPVSRLPMAPYPAPPREHCRPLLAAAVDVANDPEAPAAVRAAWILFTVGEIHPFADGNGRVARLLQLLVAGEDLPKTVDWGVSEQIRYFSDRFLSSLRGHDPEPCIRVVVGMSTDGAALMRDRLAVLGVLVPELARKLGLTIEGATLLAAVWLRRSGHGHDLAVDVDRSYPETVADLETLVAAGMLERRPDRHDREAPEQPVTPAYGLTVDANAEVRRAIGPMERDHEGHGAPAL
jgi:hypothetical protein